MVAVVVLCAGSVVETRVVECSGGDGAVRRMGSVGEAHGEL